ncbi:MAG: helix-turn-helix domain-containing protein [Nanoarchaeota archaeon]|nr:helix-turn-helix domain-containing protein [Nanoarchaeota archaeon]MBU4086891.1 helix-turn-helix domain-containing protein [Nanoarchaeota archaeon]
MNNKYVLVSFDDERMKSISEVLGNASCKKILNLLAERNSSETDISRELGMPLNTVGYNVKKLVEAGLIERAEHFWSVKGKKIPVYRVSQKSIVISPRQKTKTALKLLPVLIVSGIAALLIRFFSFSEKAMLSVNDKVAGASLESAPSAGVNLASYSLWDKIISLPAWEWFLAGALFSLIVYFVFSLIAERRKF